jgi:hypothetical protein
MSLKTKIRIKFPKRPVHAGLFLYNQLMEKKMKRRIESIIVIALAMILVGCGSKTQRPWGTLKECEQEQAVGTNPNPRI